MIIECTQAKPFSLSGPYFSIRISVNNSAMNRVYFSNSEPYTLALFIGISHMSLDICSQIVNGSSPTSRLTGEDGNFDILNFVMLAAPGGFFQNTECKHVNVYFIIFNSYILTVDPNCLKMVILSPGLTACLQCTTNYYLYETSCVLSCPNYTNLHVGTSSCQGN